MDGQQALDGAGEDASTGSLEEKSSAARWRQHLSSVRIVRTNGPRWCQDGLRAGGVRDRTGFPADPEPDGTTGAPCAA